jgi:hypothetical protein
MRALLIAFTSLFLASPALAHELDSRGRSVMSVDVLKQRLAAIGFVVEGPIGVESRQFTVAGTVQGRRTRLVVDRELGEMVDVERRVPIRRLIDANVIRGNFISDERAKAAVAGSPEAWISPIPDSAVPR